jgi:hypothetical protein
MSQYSSLFSLIFPATEKSPLIVSFSSEADFLAARTALHRHVSKWKKKNDISSSDFGCLIAKMTKRDNTAGVVGTFYFGQLSRGKKAEFTILSDPGIKQVLTLQDAPNNITNTKPEYPPTLSWQ